MKKKKAARPSARKVVKSTSMEVTPLTTVLLVLLVLSLVILLTYVKFR